MNAFWKTTRKTLTAFVLALVAGVTSMQAMAEQTFNWRFSNLYSRGTAYAEVYENFARNIETMSNGRIRIQVLYAGEGVGQTGVLGAVKSGLVQMGAIFQPAHSGEIPFGVVEIGLPGTTDDATKLSALFHEQGWQPILEQAYNQQGVEWIETYFQPAVYVLTNKPIRSIDDFKGLKIRAPGAYGKFFRELGASPVSLAWNEIYTSLATGVIDGSIGSNLIDHRDGNHVEVAKYMYPLPVAGAQAMPIIVNKKAWDSLPEDLKAIVKTAGRPACPGTAGQVHGLGQPGGGGHGSQGTAVEPRAVRGRPPGLAGSGQEGLERLRQGRQDQRRAGEDSGSLRRRPLGNGASMSCCIRSFDAGARRWRPWSPASGAWLPGACPCWPWSSRLKWSPATC